MIGHEIATDAADRVERIFVERGIGNVEVGDFGVKEADERPHQPALALAFFSEEEHIVTGNQGQGDFRDDGILIPDDTGEQLDPLGVHPQKIIAKLFFE